MHTLVVWLAAIFAWQGANIGEPSEAAMREAFASYLAEGVRSVLAFVQQTGGEAALARIYAAHTDEYDIRSFRKLDCRSVAGKAGYLCTFAVEIDTVTGPIERSIMGRFYVERSGLAYDHDA